jgi:hypothetical protein
MTINLKIFKIKQFFLKKIPESRIFIHMKELQKGTPNFFSFPILFRRWKEKTAAAAVSAASERKISWESIM